MSDPLTDPADLWPSPPTAKRGEPQRWVWAAMEPPERRLRMRELAGWVDWLRTTFELHNQITHCWYLHSAVVEHLTALYAGWMRTYVGEEEPARELAEADWINTLHAFTPRFQLAACATGLRSRGSARGSPTAGRGRGLRDVPVGIRDDHDGRRPSGGRRAGPP